MVFFVFRRTAVGPIRLTLGHVAPLGTARQPYLLLMNTGYIFCAALLDLTASLLQMDGWTGALMDSLAEAPLLVGDLPEASVLDRSLLGVPAVEHQLNFQQKLGHLYEDALQHLIEQSPKLSLLASHLQVIDAAGITRGEMDFLVRDESAGCDFQLELAVKFYLAHRTEEGWSYPGPDPRDNWLRKLERMRTHQLQLARLPTASVLLEERFGITQLAVRQLIYGRLFLPIDVTEDILPKAMQPDGLRGRWLSRAQWSEFLGVPQDLRVIPKPLWPALLNDELVERLPVVSQVELFEMTIERCTMFVTSDLTEPFFLVPDSWLDTLGCTSL